MAELDATQMPEETTPSAEVNTTDLNTTEDTSPDLNTVEEPAVDQEPQGKAVSKEELAKRYLPKTRTSISTETSKIQTVAEPASTAVQKPVAAKPKSTNLLTQTQEEADKEAYRTKKLEYELAPKGKKPEFKLDAKRELEDFLGGKIGSIDWNAYDKSKLKEEREAIKAKIEKDVDPNYDPSGVLTFINMITPNALKSGVASIGSQLAGFSAAAAQYIDKASKESVTGGAFGETTPERKAAQTTTGEDLYKSLYNTAASLDKKSQDYMMVAEKNSGIKEENIGKGAFELLSSNKPGDTWDGLKKLGLSVTQQIPQLIALAATGGSSAGVMAGSTVLGTGGAITQEYKKDQDISVPDAWKSVAKGIIEGATETLFMGDIKALRSLGVRTIKLDMSGAKKTMSDYLKERGRKALEQEINRTYFQGIRTVFKNSIGEGGEEILASVGGFIVDRIEDGKWNQEEYDKLMKETQEAFLVGAATGFAASSTALATSVTPLTTEQKRKIVSFRQIANDETVDKDVRALAKKHADDIINYSADLATRKYSILSSLPIEKRKVALSIENKIKGLEESKPKLKDVGAEEQVDKDIAKLKEDWSKVVVEHAVETAKADAEAKAKKVAQAPKVMTSNSTEISTATEAMEVDPSMVDADFEMLKGLSLEQKQTLVNILKAMNSINPDGKILLYANEAEMRQGLINSGLSSKEAYEKAASSSAEFTVKSSGADPVVHVNLANTDNAIRSASHEVAHLALLELSKTNPEAFLAMRDSVLRVMKNSQAKPLIDFASQYSAKLETAEANQERAEEFLAEMIGALTSGEGKIERTILDQLARIIRDFLLQASRSFGNKNLEDFINKTFADTTSSEALANYFESLAKQLKVGGKIDVSTLSDVIPLTPAQEARLQGLTPGTDAYHQAAMTNAVENSPSAARPTMEADQSLVQNPDDVVSRSQLAESNFIESPQFKKYLKVVKGMTPQDVWLGRALFMDENRGGKMFASGTKEEIIEQMKKEMDQIEADANNSNKYYITELKPPYIAAQIAKFEKDPALTDNLTQWKMIRDNENMREKYIKEKAAEQKAALTGNIAYLKGNDTYDVAFQYAMIKDGISSRYTVVPAAEPGGDISIQRDSIKPSQLNSTEKPIITIQPGIAASAYGDYGNYITEPGRGYLVAQINMPKIEINASEFAPFIFKESDTGEGTWLKFNQSSNKEDAKPLFKIASTSHKYPAQWCTGGALSTAEYHLSGGDFYVFVDKKTGDARIAVRYNGNNRISEVRGLGAGQSVLPEDAGIIDELVNTLPGGEEYKKDSKVQNALKEIIDSLPDLASKKRFALTEYDFKDWLIDNPNEIEEELKNNTPAKVSEAINERIIAIDNVIEDTVIKKLTDKSYSKQDIIDIISLVDKSYRKQNHALSRTKQVINNNIDKIFKPLGYEEGSVVKSSTIKGDDNPKEYEKAKLVIGDLNVINTGNSISFPNLEDVTGKIAISDSWDVDVEDIQGTTTINFPSLLNVNKVKIDIPRGGVELNFDSLKQVNEVIIEESSNENYVKLNFPKLEKFDTDNSFDISEKMSFNAPLLKEINNSNNSAYVNVYGQLNTPNLKLIQGDTVIQADADVNLGKLEQVSHFRVKSNTVDLPSLKYADSIQANFNSVLRLNEINTNTKNVKFGSKISADNNSKIFINKLTTFSDSNSSKVEAYESSKIVINEIEREGGFNVLGGVNGYTAYGDSEISVLKGSNTSWADVNIMSGSKINLPGVYRIKELDINDSKFSSDSVESIYKVSVSDGSVKLDNAISIEKAGIFGASQFEANKLGSLGDLSVEWFIEGINKNKIHLPNVDNLRKLNIKRSDLSLPNIQKVWVESRIADLSKVNLPNLKYVGGEGLTVGEESFASIPLLDKISGKSLYVNLGSTLEANELSQLPNDTYIQNSSKLFAPKLGYNGTSFPEGTVAKSQLAPNGKPSNLNRAQYETVRTPEFKAWFGDWENDPENASKFVDENGEPQVFYHGTYADFERFSTDPELKRHEIHNRGIFFTPTVTGAKSYGDIQMPVFLNAKTVDYNTADINNSFKAEREKENNLIDNTDKEGVVLKTIDKESITVGDKDGMVKQYVVFDPNQILLAGDKTYAKSQLLDRFKKFASQIVNKPSGELLAPNGKPSNLPPRLYNMVRKPEFKKWFGDWEKGEGSKALDENNEPLLVFHNSDRDQSKFEGYVTYFTDNKDYAANFKGFKFENELQYSVFLNMRKPYIVPSYKKIVDAPKEIHDKPNSDLFAPRVAKEELIKQGFDGIIGVDAGQEKGKTYVTFNSDQSRIVSKSQLADPMLYLGAYGDQKTYVPGTSSAKEAEAKANKPQSLKEVIQLFEKEFTERNVHIADFMKNADMMQSFYNMYNKAGATPWATRMFAEAYRDVYGKVNGKGLSKRDKGFLDDVILLRRVIAIDENFDNRKEPRPKHTSFDDYETKKKVQLSKEEALKQLDLLKTKVYANNPAKFDELVHRSEKYFEAFSGILKFKLDNGIITQDEYDMYKNYNYQPRKFLKFILADTKPEAFNTRGIQIKQDEFKNIQSGDEGYMMTDSEQLLKMGFVSAVNQVFSNRAKVAIFNELAGRDLGWAKPAKVDTYANGTPKLNPDGSPKLLEPNIGYRNITFKVDGKRNAFQMKESLAREFEDTELWNTQNRFYKFMVALMGAKLTSAMAVGISPAFILTNIPTDVFSQVHVNNLFQSRFGAPGQLVKGFTGTLAKSLEIAKAKTGLGDNSRILNLINDYGKLGGLQNTLSYDTNILGKVGDALGMLGDISELASKLNAFEKRRAGLLKDFIKKNKANPTAEEYEKIEMQAAYEARAAMDFNRGGRVTKFMNAFLPFLNVGAQATKLTTSYIKNHFPAFTKKIMQAGLPYMGLTMYNLMVAGDDWENEDLKRDKKNKIIIMSPYKNADGTHSYTKLQIPAAIKVFFNVFSIIAENIYYSQIAPAQGVKVPAVDKSITKEMIDNLKMFVPAIKSTLMPPTAKFFDEYANNESIWNERSLSQDALRKIIITQEGEENPDVLSLYKILAKNTAQITKDTWMNEMGMIGRDGIEVSPERFQKAAEDSWFTSPESQALLSTMYLVADQMTNFVVGGVDEKLRSKYLGNGDYSGVMAAWAKSFKNRLIGKTDKKKNELYYDMKEDMEMIESAQRKENSLHQDISYKIKDIFKSYKALDLPYTAAKPEVMEFYKSIKDPKDKEYAKNYIEMMIGNLQVELVNNIPKYRLILKEAKSARTKATAIYAMFTMRGQDPMTDKTLQKDLAKMGFSGEVVKQYKKIAKMEEAKKGVDVSDNIDPKTGLPPGFNPEDYK